MEANTYDHYVAIDWSLKNMAIARMTGRSNKITVVDVPSDLTELRAYLKSLQGTKILTIEETTTSQWLYTELKDFVNRIVICDPYRNRLLSDGPKTDKIDAAKLVQLLKAGLLKEVYHSAEKFLHLRRLVSGYEDLVQAGVRVQMQRGALLRGCGKTGEERRGINLKMPMEQFVLEGLEKQIVSYKEEKKRYEQEFEKFARRYPEIRHQQSLPGIGLVSAVKIVSRVVSPHRFPDSGHFLSYAGLVKLEKISGGRSYGQRNSRYCSQLKSAYKSAILAAIRDSRDRNEIRDCYDYLVREKGYPEYNARHKACRKLATLSWGVFKSGKRYQPKRRTDVDQRDSGN